MVNGLTKILITTRSAPAAIGPYSQAIKANGFIFCSGQIPLTAGAELIQGDIKAQTRQVIKNLAAVLEAAGSSLNNVVKTTVYLSNIQNFAEFNEVYAEFFKASSPTDSPPARSIVESPHLPKGAMVEIESIAVLS